MLTKKQESILLEFIKFNLKNGWSLERFLFEAKGFKTIAIAMNVKPPSEYIYQEIENYFREIVPKIQVFNEIFNEGILNFK